MCIRDRAKFGLTYWLPLASAANVAQGGAAFAVALKSKNAKVDVYKRQAKILPIVQQKGAPPAEKQERKKA